MTTPFRKTGFAVLGEMSWGTHCCHFFQTQRDLLDTLLPYIYGIDAPEGHVSFIPEMGAHAGPSPDELHTFIIASAKVTLPSRISHPVQLYDHFIRYQSPRDRAMGHAPSAAGEISPAANPPRVKTIGCCR